MTAHLEDNQTTLFEAAPCESCGYPLLATETFGPSGLETPEGRAIVTAAFECAGPERHAWRSVRDGEEVRLEPVAPTDSHSRS